MKGMRRGEDGVWRSVEGGIDGCALVLAGIIVLGMCAGSCFAPCSWLGWMPVTEIPARCLGPRR